MISCETYVHGKSYAVESANELLGCFTAATPAYSRPPVQTFELSSMRATVIEELSSLSSDLLGIQAPIRMVIKGFAGIP